MKNYSSPAQISSFLKALGPNPMFVVDMDGDVVEGYRLTEGGVLPGAERLSEEDRKQQDIPFGTGPEELADHVSRGVLQRSIFAKPMDVRLPLATALLVNDLLSEGSNFSFVPLTSRGTDSARKVLEESGIRNLNRLTMATNSGATLVRDGVRRDLRPLSSDEKYFLSGLDAFTAGLQSDVNRIVRGFYGETAEVPDLFVEHKGAGAISSNIHWRGILDRYKEAGGSALDNALGVALKSRLQEYVAIGPKESNGDCAFKVLDGPGTLELKIASVHKGLGLAKIVEEALECGGNPSAIVFAGDDVAKGNGYPGTDYDAMIAAKGLSLKHGLAFYNIHAHHPLGEDMEGRVPDPAKSPETLSEKFAQPDIHLSVPTPRDVNSIILRAFGRNEDGIPPEKRNALEQGLRFVR